MPSVVVARSSRYWKPLAAGILFCGFLTRVPNAFSASTEFQQRSRCPAQTCEIVLVPEARLSDVGQEGTIPTNLPFVYKERERYLMYSRRRDRVVAFDSSGRIVASVGKRGDAFADYGRIEAILPHDQGLFVYDIGRRRLLTLDRSLRTVAAIPMERGPDFVLKDGSFLVAKQIPTPALVGYPMHVVGRDGRVLRSFGADVPQYRADMRLFTERVVYPAADGTMWAAAPGKYQFERWDPNTGKRVAQLKVPSTWFRESVRRNPDERVRPNPIIESLWENDGLLWVFSRDADTAWKAPAQANTERAFDLSEYNRTYDWIIEVLETGTGRILAHKRLPEVLYATRQSKLIVTRKASQQGKSSVLDLWKAELRPKEAKR